MKINMHEWRRQLIASPKTVAIPVMTHPGIEAIGHTVREAITDGDIHAQAIRFLADHFPTGGTCVVMDLTVEAEAFGAPIIFPEDEIASVNGRLLHTIADIEQLQVPSLHTGRISQYLRANALAARDVTDRPVFAGCIGPFSLAGRLYDMSEIMMLTLSEPQAAHLLLQKCTEFILRYCMALKASGANGVLMAEPAAGLMSDDDCMKFSSQYVKQIVDAVQDETFMVVLHNCGNTGHCTHAMVATGADGYHFGNKCEMAEVMRDVPADKLGMGNLDPVSIFKQGSAEEVYEATTALLDSCKAYPNFVISSGCDTPPHTPMANVEAFFDAIAHYNND